MSGWVPGEATSFDPPRDGYVVRPSSRGLTLLRRRMVAVSSEGHADFSLDGRLHAAAPMDWAFTLAEARVLLSLARTSPRWKWVDDATPMPRWPSFLGGAT